MLKRSLCVLTLLVAGEEEEGGEGNQRGSMALL